MCILTYLLKYLEFVLAGSFSFSVLSGKVMFRDVYFINEDMSIRYSCNTCSCVLFHFYDLHYITFLWLFPFPCEAIQFFTIIVFLIHLTTI